MNSKRIGVTLKGKSHIDTKETSIKNFETDLPDPIDMEILDSLREVMEEDFPELLSLFLNGAPEQVASLTAFAEKDDSDGISKTTHSLKSSSANLGALTFSALCSDLESDTRLEKTASLLEKIKAIEIELMRVKSVLELEYKKI